jgi:two-component system, OmpR family, response regulator
MREETLSWQGRRAAASPPIKRAEWVADNFCPDDQTANSALSLFCPPLIMQENVRILVVEDDEKIASFVVKGLKQNGYAVDLSPDGEGASALASAVAYDAAIVDLMLPKLDGLTLIERLRARGNRAPVLILSAKASVDDRIKGLQAGGDDYLTKPFAFSELLARVQALIRRATQTTEPTRLKVGNLTLDLLTREVRRGTELIELQPREFALLEYLMRHPGRVVTKTMILEHIFDFSFDPQTNVVDVLVHRLRNKADPDKQMIQTLRGVGYVLRSA